eukprot:m51a1_g11173 hypothetical protein (135) ;mRNA; f:309433-310154
MLTRKSQGGRSIGPCNDLAHTIQDLADDLRMYRTLKAVMDQQSDREASLLRTQLLEARQEAAALREQLAVAHSEASQQRAGAGEAGACEESEAEQVRRLEEELARARERIRELEGGSGSEGRSDGQAASEGAVV